MAAKIKKGDRVIVTTGRDKGKKGEVLKVFPSEEDRALVSGVNVVKRHQRQTQTRPGRHREQGSRRSICPISRMSIPRRARPTRIGFKMLGDGRKVRFAKKSGEVIDV